MEAGALGCSISGAGPKTFAWVHKDKATAVRDAMRGEFQRKSIELDEWIVEIQSAGSRVIT